MEIKLKEFRKKHNLTQKQAADSIGIEQRQWSRYEIGKNEIPVHYIVEICQKHNVSADYLLGLDQEGRTPLDNTPRK